jgi:glycosyltransferase involved in cell wall biosynthesis
MIDKKKIFVSIIFGYQKYFYNFAPAEHYHMHALKVARDLGYTVIVMLIGQKNIIENDPLFNKETRVIYCSNFLYYLIQVIKYSLKNSIFYVNSVESRSLIVPFLARKTIFMGHAHPVRQTRVKQVIFNFSMKFFSKIRLTNIDEKDFLLRRGLNEEKLKVVPLSISLSDYRMLDSGIKKNDLVYFGNITKKKNLVTIIKACNLVSDKYPDIKLHLIGDEYDKIDEDLVARNLKIIKYGFKKSTEANTLLNKFLICLNSSFDEGMCVAVYNAALAGCSLCLPKIMSFTGVFKDKALFHEATDHDQLAKNIIYYLENPQIANEYNKLCQGMIIRDYSYQKISEQLKNLFTF